MDDAKRHNEEMYDRLISLIENSQGRLAPIVVACDDLRLRDRMIGRYETEARQAKIRPYRIVLGKEPSLRSGLAKLKEQDEYLQNDGEAVFTVTGAELLLRVKLNPQEKQSEIEKFFGYLQWSREGLREFRYPIVLWVTAPILREMKLRAADFWSWRKAELRFLDESNDVYLVGQHQRAFESYQQSLEIRRKIGDQSGEADLLLMMADSLAKLNHTWEALQHYQQARQIYQELGLDFKVEECDIAIYNLEAIIPDPPILGVPKSATRPNYVPSESRHYVRSKPRRHDRQKILLLCFVLGIAIALLIWFLTR